MFGCEGDRRRRRRRGVVVVVVAAFFHLFFHRSGVFSSTEAFMKNERLYDAVGDEFFTFLPLLSRRRGPVELKSRHNLVTKKLPAGRAGGAEKHKICRKSIP